MGFMAKYSPEKKAEIMARVDALRDKGKSAREACSLAKAPYPAYTYWDRQRQGMPTLKQLKARRPEESKPTAERLEAEEVLVLSGSTSQLMPVLRLAQALGAEVLTHQIKPRGAKTLP